MNLRKLEAKDAPLMLEWTRDESVTRDLSANFGKKTERDCLSFIELAKEDTSNIHLAIVSDEDEYMGTVSLKHIDKVNKRAEFAIAIREKAMGRGYSWFGMNEIIKLGFNVYKLDAIYWCVSKKNTRACKFYDKHGFYEMLDVDDDILRMYEGFTDLKWYIVKNDKKSGYGRRPYRLFSLLNIKTIGTENAGQLSYLEGV
ncbi:MAG: GNAT family N-acetyltransferase, partial [Bacilli bacterium]|nr:GNAT family N-acetyltransferase [Bacilli bacterium]